MIFRHGTTPAQHRAAAEAGRAQVRPSGNGDWTIYASADGIVWEKCTRISDFEYASGATPQTLIDTLPQEVWDTADETGIEAGQIGPRTQIDTDAMWRPTDDKA